MFVLTGQELNVQSYTECEPVKLCICLQIRINMILRSTSLKVVEEKPINSFNPKHKDAQKKADSKWAVIKTNWPCSTILAEE